MRNENTIVIELLQDLRNKLSPGIEEPWNMIVVLVKVNSDNLASHILYFDESGIKKNFTTEQIPEEVAVYLLQLNSNLQEKRSCWNELEINFHSNSTIELHYYFTLPW